MDSGILYIVATPIGNLADFTLRAIKTLQEATIIYAEDTRITKNLCNHYGIKTPLRCYNDHAQDQLRTEILQILQNGGDVALVSDAGTPNISDPGFKLLRLVKDANIKISPVAGASSLTAFLSCSVIENNNFTFLGFLPHKEKARREILTKYLYVAESLFIMESPSRILRCLADIEDIMPSRRLEIGRELTKKFEEFITGTASEVAEILKGNFADKQQIKGEFVMLIEGNKQELTMPKEAENMLNRQVNLQDFSQYLVRELGVNKASRLIAEATKLHKNKIYKILSEQS
jgi:16S rRNA (cytidine1402-2'-O)-methyltransferase